jgi:multiple sugar transport system permease protein
MFWAFVTCFDLLTVTTSFKSAIDVTQGHLVLCLTFNRIGKAGARWPVAGYDPAPLHRRSEFVSRFANNIITSVGASVLALVSITGGTA